MPGLESALTPPQQMPGAGAPPQMQAPPVPSGGQPAATPQEYEARKIGWRSAFDRINNDPKLLMTLFTIGNHLSQGAGYGPSIGAGMGYQAGLAEMQMKLQDREWKKYKEMMELYNSGRRTDAEVDRAKTARDRLGLDTRKWDEGAEGREAEADAKRAQAEKDRAAAKAGGTGAKPGAQQQLINFMAENAMASGKFDSREEAVDHYFNAIVTNSKGKSNSQIRREVMADVISSGIANDEDIENVSALLDRFYPEDGPTGAIDRGGAGSTAPPPPPRVGERQGNFIYKGGDPGDPMSWEKAE